MPVHGVLVVLQSHEEPGGRGSCLVHGHHWRPQWAVADSLDATAGDGILDLGDLSSSPSLSRNMLMETSEIRHTVLGPIRYVRGCQTS